ncbi:MAG: 50S ribosomal protein L23 [Acidimicrobiales bacterium]
MGGLHPGDPPGNGNGTVNDPRDVILRPVVSEKSYGLLDRGVYTFVVHKRATKIEVRDAVEAIFDVQVTKVNTLNRKGKRKRNRRSPTFGSRADTKRAIVTLAPGARIDLFES